MNLAQIRTAVRDILTAGGGKNTNIATDNFWANSEIDFYINAAQSEVYKAIRRARADYFTRILRSTDSIQVIDGHTFDPSSLRWQAGVGNYELPHDFLRMKLITDLSDSRVRMTASDIAKYEFRILMNSNSGFGYQFFYDILGIRTLIVRPLPVDIRDFEFIYEKKLPTLKDRTTGTVSVIQGNTTATFSAGADISNYASVGMQLVVGTTTTDPVADPTETYPEIKTIDSATQVTLTRPYLEADATNAKYILSPVSEIPANHHEILVAYATVLGFKKGTNPHSDSVREWQDIYNSQLPSLITEVELRHSELETVQAYLEDFGDD